jgi:hypothetical protein
MFNFTSTYGKGFKRTKVANQYSIRIYTGGFAGVDTAMEKAKKEADQFLEQSDFSAYKILGARRIWLPFSCVEVTVEFS